MGNKVITESNVDLCVPELCYSDARPNIFVRSYDTPVFKHEGITVTWDILNTPSGVDISANNVKYGTDPFELNNTVAGSGNGPYTASFSAPDETAIFFKVEIVVDNITMSTALIPIIISPTSSSSSDRIDPITVIDRIEG
tara:strand:+ start:317 stop:736 length:420 start_codon:yes stop_codon:yes gene_type:complete